MQELQKANQEFERSLRTIESKLKELNRGKNQDEDKKETKIKCIEMLSHLYQQLLDFVMNESKSIEKWRSDSYTVRNNKNHLNPDEPVSSDKWLASLVSRDPPKNHPSLVEMWDYMKQMIGLMDEEIRLRQAYNMDWLRVRKIQQMRDRFETLFSNMNFLDRLHTASEVIQEFEAKNKDA
jgi:chromosome segregation ATPase